MLQTLTEFRRAVLVPAADKARQALNESEPTLAMVAEARWQGISKLHDVAAELLDPDNGAFASRVYSTATESGLELNNYQLNLGAPMSGTSLHFHHAAVTTLMFGAKRWALYPPGDAFFSTRHAYDDFGNITRLELGTPLMCAQQAGDALFIPPRWGHGALYEQTSISLSFLYRE